MPDTASDTNTSKKLVLIDGNSLLYRGFFAMRALTTSAGQHTNAVFSFTMMLLTLIQDQKPDVMIAAWDTSKPTFRHEEYKEYKGTRSAPPPELKQQGPLARELVQAFNIPMIEAPGFEADDIIGTLSKRGREQGYEVLIVTGDLDALQLVEPGVRVMTTVKGVTDTVIYDDEAVMKRYGLRPDQLADFRGLKGDTSDNIPGVPGVGDKTAAQLLQQYDTVENLLLHLDEIKQAKLQASLMESTDQITISKRLAVILRDVPLDGVDIPALDADPQTPDWSKVRALFERLEFRQMLKRIPGGNGNTGESVAVSPTNQKGGATPAVSGAGGRDIEAEDYDPFAATDEDEIPAQVAAAAAPPADFRIVETADDEAEMVEAVRTSHRVGLRLHVTDGILDSDVLGVAFATGTGTVFYVPVEAGDPHPPRTELRSAGTPSPVNGGRGVDNTKPQTSLFDLPDSNPTAPLPPLTGEGVPAERSSVRGGWGLSPLPPFLRTLLEDPKIAKVTHDAKHDIGVLRRYGVELAGVDFDTELAAYLLNAGRRSGYPLNEIAADFAGRELQPLDKKERKTMEEADIRGHERSETLAEADALLAIMGVQEPRLSAAKLTSVLQTLDLPLSAILAEMELSGVAVDVDVLNRIAREMQEKIGELEKEIFEKAGQEFSIGSTKQLQEVLFEKLKIPSGKKTKTGYSTGAEVLEELAPEYPIVSLILRHRALTKLKNTYAEAMPALVRPDTGRIHTSLNQTVAATGRLSSSNPNLQNIPVRTEIGREIRRAFIAPPGTVLVSADYSQIELRLFAHVTRDPALVDAFSSGEDIHKYTAGKMYNIPVAEVTGDMRRAAKTVNYAVIYGISEFALARRLGISMVAAKELKTSYFERFPGVRTYLDETIAFARDNGYVQTLFGRRRYIPDITSRVFQFRQAAERAAANMPIQGSSADIMKLAMIRVYDMLKSEKLRSRVLLQVHDELLFEAPPDEVAHLATRVKECMSQAYPLSVALDVDVKTGATWADVTPVADATAEVEALTAE